MPYCDDVGRCLYFLEYALPTSAFEYCFLVFKYISISIYERFFHLKI